MDLKAINSEISTEDISYYKKLHYQNNAEQHQKIPVKHQRKIMEQQQQQKLVGK